MSMATSLGGQVKQIGEGKDLIGDRPVLLTPAENLADRTDHEVPRGGVGKDTKRARPGSFVERGATLFSIMEDVVSRDEDLPGELRPAGAGEQLFRRGNAELGLPGN